MTATPPKAPGDVLGAVYIEATNSLRTSSTGVGGGGTSMTDDDAFTVGAGGITPAGGIYRSLLDAVDDGDAGAFAMTINRALHSHLVNATGIPVGIATTDIAGGADLGLVVRVASAPASGGGVQYTEGDTDLSITGTALMFESNTGTNTLSVVNATTPLPVGDAGGSLTVDNAGTFAVQAAQSGTWNVGTVTTVTGVTTVSTVTAVTSITNPVTANHAATGVIDGRTTVTTAGTRVALASSTAAKQVIITAETDNTGIVVVGGSTVVAALATRQGTPLAAGDSVVLPIDNLADVNLDAMVNGEGVTYTAVT